MTDYLSPEEVVQAQLDAFNARDINTWLATYATDARQFVWPAQLVATGHAQIKERAETRFQEADLHAHLIKRAIMGDLVIDSEKVTRLFPDGPGYIELTCMYEVKAGKIQNASFIFGPRID